MRHSLYTALVGLLLSLTSQASHAQSFPNGYAVPNWQDQATQNLISVKTGKPVTFAEIKSHPRLLRCIKMNNYWCIKDVGWNGRLGRDKAKHTVFKSAQWSARAVARDLKSKYNRNLKSAIKIADAYAPWNDTLGSRAYRAGERACTKPKDMTSFAHCKKQPHCNCPPKYARQMVKGTGKTMSQDLKLVARDRKTLLPSMRQLMKNMSIMETGWAFASPELISKGIALEAK